MSRHVDFEFRVRPADPELAAQVDAARVDKAGGIKSENKDVRGQRAPCAQRLLDVDA